MFRKINWFEVWKEFDKAEPYNHVVIDNFFIPEIADKLSDEFPDYTNDGLMSGKYDSPLENKKTLNYWDKFPPCTYRTLMSFGEESFMENIKFLIKRDDVYFDYGLNGGGWHMHGKGGNNNVHLDYNMHPKLHMQRKLNIIVYLTKDWDTSWGGGLELWSHDEKNNSPKERIKTIDNLFNRAVIFDTTQNSWHGLPKHIDCPEGAVRKSLAVYYVCPAAAQTEKREKALFSPREEQKNDPAIAELIAKRANTKTAEQAYRR